MVAPCLLADEEQLRVVDDLDRALGDLRRDVERLPRRNAARESFSRLQHASCIAPHREVF
jgi:ArsR family metal-binding transcriptional regulator